MICLDLQRQGFGPDAVPPAGKAGDGAAHRHRVQRLHGPVHPEVAHAVSLAARTVGLDIAGIDLVGEDIQAAAGNRRRHRRSERRARPADAPQARHRQPQPVGQAIVDHLFAEDETGRIPIVGWPARAGQRGVASGGLAAALNGKHVGLACREGLFLGTRCVEKRDSSRWDAAHRLLMNRVVNAAVIENDARSILTDGLSYDRCHVGVVTDMGGMEQLADHDIQDSDKMLEGHAHPGGRGAVRRRQRPQCQRPAPRRDGRAERRRGRAVRRRRQPRRHRQAPRQGRSRGAVFLARGGAAVLAEGPPRPRAPTSMPCSSALARPTDALVAWARREPSPPAGHSDLAELIAAGLDTFVPDLHLA